MNKSIDSQRQEQITLQNKVTKFLDDKKGSTILLRGEHGNGKSKIVNEVLNVQHLSPSIHKENKFVRNIISVNYDVDELFHGEELSLNIWKHLIKDIEISFCNISSGSDGKFTKSEYAGIVRKVISDVGVDWLKLIPVFGDISAAGLKSINSTYKLYKEEKNIKEKEKKSMFTSNILDIFDQLKAYLIKVVNEFPTIIYINNIQWGDNTSLEFLGYLCRYIKMHSPRLLLILTYSDKEIFGNEILSKNNFHELLIYLEKYDLFDSITVGNLDSTRIQNYLTSLELPYDIDDKFCDKLYELSSGNMFFINIILKNLSGQKDISAKSIESFPERLSLMIKEYLKDLSADAKEILKVCSTMGETFSMEVIAKLFEHSDNEMEKLIQEIVDNSLIVSSKKKLGNLKRIYQFTQFLIYKYIYSTYDENIKMNKHQQIAKLLSGSRNTYIFNMYLHHWGIGNYIINESNELIIDKEALTDEEILENSKEYLKQMIILSEKYQSQFVLNEALNLFNKIIYLTNLLNDNETLIAYSICKNDVLQSMGKYDEALQLLNSLSDNHLNLNEENFALIDLCKGDLHERRDENQEALDYFHKAEKLYEKSKNENGLAKTYGKIGTIYFKKNDFETALNYYDKKIQLCKKLNLLIEEHKACNQIANIHLEKGEFDEAEVIYKKNYDFYSNIGDLILKMSAIGNLGIVYKYKKMLAEAMICSNEQLELSLKLFDKREEMRALGNIANLYLEKDDFTDALNYFDKVLKISTELGDVTGIAATTFNIGLAFIGQNKHKEAKDYLLKALKISEEFQNKVYQIEILEAYIQLLIKLNETPNIKELILKGSALANEISSEEHIEKFNTLFSKYNNN